MIRPILAESAPVYVAGVKQASGSAIRVIVVMGVAGAGKTEVGRALAGAIGWRFEEGDDYHSRANKEKMARGEGLTDEDRAPWLAALQAFVAGTIARDGPAVLACSALKESYRAALVPPDAPSGAVRFVYLDVPRDVLESRLRDRKGHYAGVSLLDSQLATLEKPRDAVWMDGTCPVSEIVESIRTALGV
jgi:gluconokinase